MSDDYTAKKFPIDAEHLPMFVREGVDIYGPTATTSVEDKQKHTEKEARDNNSGNFCGH